MYSVEHVLRLPHVRARRYRHYQFTPCTRVVATARGALPAAAGLKMQTRCWSEDARLPGALSTSWYLLRAWCQYAASLAGRVKQTRQRTRTKPLKNSPDSITCSNEPSSPVLPLYYSHVNGHTAVGQLNYGVLNLCTGGTRGLIWDCFYWRAEVLFYTRILLLGWAGFCFMPGFFYSGTWSCLHVLYLLS